MFNRLWRVAKTLFIKLKRTKGTPHSIALGVAVGLFIGTVIPIGGQIVAALLLAFILRANKLMAVVFTCYTNPYTVPVLYPLFCLLGAKIARLDLSIRSINENVAALVKAPSWSTMSDFGEELLLSFFVGAGVIGVILGVAGYFITFWLIARHREKVEAKMAAARFRISQG